MTEEQQPELPLYRCHKDVRALKIGAIVGPIRPKTDAGGIPQYYVLKGVDAGEVSVCPDYVDRHKPKVHGYYVRYADGYESFSPRVAFEDGYTLVDGHEHRAEHAADDLSKLRTRVHRDLGYTRIKLEGTSTEPSRTHIAWRLDMLEILDAVLKAVHPAPPSETEQRRLWTRVFEVSYEAGKDHAQAEKAADAAVAACRQRFCPE